ncbi:MAG: NAD(P)-dependent alcohol dehydrogenase [Paracoccaceae bacterium]|jgi:NADPH:quinone reductase-like Zn-dependent oxidoreductase
MKTYEIVAPGIDALSLNDRDVPKPARGQVLVRMKASALNYRDLLNVVDPATRGISYPRIPNSDGAGEVVEVGEGVTRFKSGDRVVATFFQNFESGEMSATVMASAMGGQIDGILTEYAVLEERGLLPIPAHMSFEEAATLPCAALTAWNALAEIGQLKAGETVLLLGTGGVSIFALQFARVHGARVIITSSSDEKLARALEMGAWQTINYVQHPDWENVVMEMTDGRGADHVVEVGGAGTVTRSIEAVRIGGTVAMIGVLTDGTLNPTAVMRKSVRLQGLYVGSRQMFERMNAAITSDTLHPVIDAQFDYGQAREAFHHMKSATHFGKIVISI